MIGTAPGPYSTTVTTGTPYEIGQPMASVRLESGIHSLHASSNLSGGFGDGVATGEAGLASAEATISFASFTDALLRIVITADDPENNPITSTATVSWNGTSTTASGTSNLLSAGSISVFAAGTLVDLPPLTSGVSSNISFSIPYFSPGPGSISGQITLTPDYVLIPDPDERLVSTASLMVDASIQIFQPGFGMFPSPIWDVSVETQIAFNFSQASMQVIPVPEPAAMALLPAGLALAGLRRRRR